MTVDRDALRTALRTRRRGLTREQRAAAARTLARHAAQLLRGLGRGAKVGAYAALPDEIDPQFLLARLRARGCAIYLPRITNYRRRDMRFSVASPPFVRNRYGILESRHGAPLRRARELDLLLVPLVGFDLHGGRLGMGGGYYDRALAFRRHPRGLQRPRLVGLAFECQRIERAPAGAHDVRLDTVVTERGVLRFRPEPR